MVLEILPRGLQRLLGRLGAGGVEIGVVGLIEGDPVLLDLHEEEAAMSETVVHLVERMDDEVDGRARSEEHTSELQSLMRISYAVFCLKKKNNTNRINRVQQKTHVQIQR